MLERDGDPLLSACAAVVPSPTPRGTHMKKWNKPVIREICVGAEINCYASGEL
ncbi:pyrroloquinoline quinone precursor peptide PqqA [Xanthomonas sacchari]|uniref:pyrroloquinoline quinone precursor peptide PqqA n=1 Tax=Xanthomonas sacchari TaxID=56458 RepID=UPI00225A7C7B|nr:pyrroloquinoline quinone precursor peptide PqqA [Xanthomonas sacchari]MCW0414184.1 Coenzyme PQQ synthesis protein A [Xanthomonas sacchari]UYK67846.1 pyrroloquinoline quinone precursor peptide PqqA [Xanthomonas sacchari]